MEEAAYYFWYAQRFNWPPDVVDDLPGRLVDRLPAVAAIYDELEQERQKAASNG